VPEARLKDVPGAEAPGYFQKSLRDLTLVCCIAEVRRVLLIMSWDNGANERWGDEKCALPADHLLQ
jgi:hypothetical protein